MTALNLFWAARDFYDFKKNITMGWNIVSERDKIKEYGQSMKGKSLEMMNRI